MPIRHFWNEFKKFAFKGNMIDLAVAVVVGNAFGAVVNALVKNIIMPIVTYPLSIVDKNGKLESYTTWHIGPIEIGPFLAELVHFLIVSLAMFLIVVKLFGTMHKLLSPESDTPANKECPLCRSVIPLEAVKCAHCTADLCENLCEKPQEGADGVGKELRETVGSGHGPR